MLVSSVQIHLNIDPLIHENKYNKSPTHSSICSTSGLGSQPPMRSAWSIARCICNILADSSRVVHRGEEQGQHCGMQTCRDGLLWRAAADLVRAVAAGVCLGVWPWPSLRPPFSLPSFPACGRGLSELHPPLFLRCANAGSVRAIAGGVRLRVQPRLWPLPSSPACGVWRQRGEGAAAAGLGEEVGLYLLWWGWQGRPIAIAMGVTSGAAGTDWGRGCSGSGTSFVQLKVTCQ